MATRAVLAGASGLIGSALLDILLQQPEYNEVILLVRTELPVANKKLTQLKIDFDQLNNYASFITGHTIFSCLGSTRKKTPNLTDYRKIDHDYPLKLAELAKKNGVTQFHLVSSMGANKKSANFYTKMKGETEEDIKKTGLPCLHIYRPALLTGDRKEKRFGEKTFTAIMKAIDPLLWGNLKNYRSIMATTVAMAMFKQSLINKEGVFIHPSDKIKQLA